MKRAVNIQFMGAISDDLEFGICCIKVISMINIPQYVCYINFVL